MCNRRTSEDGQLRLVRVTAKDLAQALALFEDDTSGEVARPDAEWLAHVTNGQNALALLVAFGNEPVGLVQFDLEGRLALVSVFLREASRGKGLLRPVLQAAARHLPAGIDEISALVSETNLRSMTAFSALGFNRSGPPDEDGFNDLRLRRDRLLQHSPT